LELALSTYSPRKAARLNPDLPINPPVTAFGSINGILTGTARRYFVADFAGPLSIKATLSGISTWKVNARDFRVSESSFLVVNAGQPYTIAYDEPSEVTTFCLFFQAGYVEQLATAMNIGAETSLDAPFRADSTEFRVGLQPGPSGLLKKLRNFAALLSTQTLSSEAWEFNFHELAIALLREAHPAPALLTKIRAVKSSTKQELFRRALVGRDFLLSMSDQPITVQDAARAACLSIFHFHRTFVEAFQISPHQFLRNFRLLRAGQMLRSTDLPVTEIASRVGFASLGSFGSAFARIHGMSPGAYRSGKQSLL
jgi:AraC-like DNA-binding protein